MPDHSLDTYNCMIVGLELWHEKFKVNYFIPGPITLVVRLPVPVPVGWPKSSNRNEEMRNGQETEKLGTGDHESYDSPLTAGAFSHTLL